MSTDATNVEAHIAARVKAERETRGWSLAELAENSGVSKAMLSKIERQEVSPTAVIVTRIATAFGRTIAEFVSSPSPAERLVRAEDQPRWHDPDTGYVRRQIFLSAENPVELVEVSLPPNTRVAMPASSYFYARHVVWVLDGKLEIRQGDKTYSLKKGDRLEFGPPSDNEYRNPDSKACRYLVSVLRR